MLQTYYHMIFFSSPLFIKVTVVVELLFSLFYLFYLLIFLYLRMQLKGAHHPPPNVYCFT